MAGETQEDWDSEAATFDNEPDHGLTDRTVRSAWRRVLSSVLPPPPARILDLGCGTGSISVLLAEMGYNVTGIDFSPRMIEQAAAKAQRHAVDVELRVGDAAAPPTSGTFNVVLTRHLLWAIPEPQATIARWFQLLTEDGRLVLIEGRWHTGAGLAAKQVTGLVEPHATHTEVLVLNNAALWAGPITDDRYLVLATR